MIKYEKKYKNTEYLLSVPNDFDETKKYPVIIFLHGAGTRQTNLDVLKSNSYFENTDPMELDAVTFAPLCDANSWFNIFEQLMEFAEFAKSQKYCDKERTYLIGVSMGGYGAWQLAMAKPELFAAIIPICGGGMYWNAETLKNVSVWAFHGKDDKIVFPEESIKMVNKINESGGNAKLTLYDNVAHGSWENALSSPETFKWLFAQKSKTSEDAENTYTDSKKFG